MLLWPASLLANFAGFRTTQTLHLRAHLRGCFQGELTEVETHAIGTLHLAEAGILAETEGESKLQNTNTLFSFPDCGCAGSRCLLLLLSGLSC